jgi:mono/diheme cytochrome c family protein
MFFSIKQSKDYAIVPSELIDIIKEQNMYKVFYIVVLLSLMILSGCGMQEPDVPFTFEEVDMSFADAGSGEKIFHQSSNDAPTCASCHGEGGSGGLGPSLQGVSETAGNRVNGQSAEEYLYWSTLSPSLYLTVGYSNIMYAKYGDVFGTEDVADLIAYMLELE